jgi:hypothetical protein
MEPRMQAFRFGPGIFMLGFMMTKKVVLICILYYYYTSLKRFSNILEIRITGAWAPTIFSKFSL